MTRDIKRIFLSESIFEEICKRLYIQNINAVIDKAKYMQQRYDENFSKNGKHSLYHLEDGTIAYKLVIMNDVYLWDYEAGDYFRDSNNRVFSSEFEFCMLNGLYIKELDYELAYLNSLSKIKKDGVDFFCYEELEKYIRENDVKELLGYPVNLVEIKTRVLEQAVDLNDPDNSFAKELRSYFNECDYRRARITPYSEDWYLTDECHGHWELWNDSSSADGEDENDHSKDDKKICIQLANSAIARNPVTDVHHNAVVGIDFGTKSTIVAVQDGDEQIIPLRIGMADYSTEPNEKHYENPTVMQFVDFEKFLSQYSRMNGRPNTSWDDLLISHEAFHNLLSSKEGREYVSYVTDLKCWASGGNVRVGSDHIVVKDATGKRFDFMEYAALTDEDIDLVELYAYYIGLFINNMYTGIYLDYILSFPETFAIETRERIRCSFYKGIKKSIPSSVFQDELCCKSFRVRQGPSEPAAYAACALEQYGIESTDEGVFYGIFDFGGGTTDYDYGVWKNAPEEELTYNYIIKHYGSGGDKSLGGENLLQLLAYNVFSDGDKHGMNQGNVEIMREKKLSFYRPEDGKINAGTESLNNHSENAILNTKQMMEALRPIWEEWKEVCEWMTQKRSFSIEISDNVRLSSVNDKILRATVLLFAEEKREKIDLMIDMEMVDKVLNSRIESGVRNFFEGLVQAYSLYEKSSNGKIHIFLAGNSSKSARVLKLFTQYMMEYDKLIFGNDVNTENNVPADLVKAPKPEEIQLSDFWGGIYNVRDEEPLVEMDQKERAFLKYLIDDYGGDTTIACLEEDEVNVLYSIRKRYQNKAGSPIYIADETSQSNPGFVLYPPLGTEYARKIQKEKGVEVAEKDYLAPTGKTGVAFGLLMCREGSMIKVESERKKSEQIKINYYIGVNYRKKFKVIFNRDTEYNKWLKFSSIAEGAETFEFYYSELSEVLGDNVLIKDNSSIKKHKCLVDNVTEDATVYFRFIAPTKLEYVVAIEENIESESYLSNVYSVEL